MIMLCVRLFHLFFYCSSKWNTWRVGGCDVTDNLSLSIAWKMINFLYMNNKADLCHSKGHDQ